MARYSDTAIEIINDLHTERMDYQSEYLPLIDAANQLAAYESTGIEPERVAEIVSIIGNDYDLGRLRELVEADKDERCAVFPFKPGENVYFIPDEVASLLLNKSLMEGRIHHISAFANGEIRISVEWNTA